jgi:hypothetical protein
MRLLFGRPVRARGRQPDHLTAPAVHVPTLLISHETTGTETTRVFPVPV